MSRRLWLLGASPALAGTDVDRRQEDQKFKASPSYIKS